MIMAMVPPLMAPAIPGTGGRERLRGRNATQNAGRVVRRMALAQPLAGFAAFIARNAPLERFVRFADRSSPHAFAAISVSGSHFGGSLWEQAYCLAAPGS